MYPTPRTRRGSRALLIAALLTGSSLAQAQTWVGGRTTPNPGEFVAVDRTGEPNWLFGAEDVAGDGLDMFAPAEQAIDLRSAYAASVNGDFYFRLYVSATTAPPEDVFGYVFINADRNTNTGGSAEAPEIDARFTNDPSDGGYEYVFAVQGNGSVVDLWVWDEAAEEFASTTPMQNRVDAEVGTDSDPVTSSPVEHGYLQGWIELDLVGLDERCNADLFFRSLQDSPELGDGDLDVGLVGPCRPRDGNGDGVPDRWVPEDRCSENAECPVNAVCIERRCVFTGVCDEDADCADAEECTPDGYCVAQEGDDCSTDAECSTGVCDDGSCVRCGGDGECADGHRCGADGRCVAEDDVSTSGGGDPELVLGPEDEVRGGACTCGIPGSAATAGHGLLLWPALFWWRRRSRRS